MPQKVLRRVNENPAFGLQAVLAASQSESPAAIASPPEDAEKVKETCDSFTLASFTMDDAWELGHLLYARLLPFSSEKPTLISISLANGGQVVFQCAVGSGVMPDNETWVQRKRNSALRWGCSTWFMHCKFEGQEDKFREKYGLSQEQAAGYAIHGGAVPIRVQGVEGVVAVVVVSGLKQHEDHGVIVETMSKNWQ
ncbi:Uu.00g079230.m01.CDS01 [Anthostomella pinea]|uniref:Uu.00g079230.m01.CDS01 n=1 Tax=Anthostomella pinea TaxID=933095 RepID=A0AAI8YJ83_9PEZI|nr:Uu.00g079230.m01.CDS01 [Anthostomella pinea]